jgi:hypothetical protein
MLPELTEQEATGHIAQIYHEIRMLGAVPDVSSLQASRSPMRSGRRPQRYRHGHFNEVLAGLDRYRDTRPQMVVFGTLIRDALPTWPRGLQVVMSLVRGMPSQRTSRYSFGRAPGKSARAD